MKKIISIDTQAQRIRYVFSTKIQFKERGVLHFVMHMRKKDYSYQYNPYTI